MQAVAAQQLENAAAQDEDAEEDIEEAGADSDGREPPVDEDVGALDGLDDEDDEAEEAPKRKRRRKRRKRVIVQVTHWSWPKVKGHLLAWKGTALSSNTGRFKCHDEFAGLAPNEVMSQDTSSA